MKITCRALVFGLVAVLLLAILLVASASRAQAPAQPADRFDLLVRADFFAGFNGDAARLERAMKRCEETLAAEPDHPGALVWHGVGLMFMAGEAARRQDLATALERARRARAELDRADRLAPDSLAVMLVRAATFNAAAPGMRDPVEAHAMQRAAVEAFERALAIQLPYLERLSEHARGELLGGLAEGWSRLGDTERARGYAERIVKELPGTRYQARADAWLEEGSQAGALTCLTCHRP
jgi:tetratricopeptide (TPR) repeat protein